MLLCKLLPILCPLTGGSMFAVAKGTTEKPTNLTFRRKQGPSTSETETASAVDIQGSEGKIEK